MFDEMGEKKTQLQLLSASPPALCFPHFAGSTNSDLWFPEEGGEQLAFEMEEVVLLVIGDINTDDIKRQNDLTQMSA